jgi:hypothetical protein
MTLCLVPECPHPGPFCRWHISQSERWRNTELGLERQCSTCDEWWPADREFFFTHWLCRACEYEASNVRRRARVAA